MYVQGFLVPVPAELKDEYFVAAGKFWDICKDYGIIDHVECWEADVKDGHTTDFRRAVKLEEGEKVVFSWVTWPDKATADAAEKKMMEDPRMAEFGEMPFDGKRMVVGGFEAVFERHAKGA